VGGPRGSYYGVPRQICLKFDVNLGGPLGSPQGIIGFFDGSPGLPSTGYGTARQSQWLLAPFLTGSPGLPSTGYWLLATSYWLLATGSWLLATGSWLLAPGYWLLELAPGTGSWN